jgi:hypothetical protein
VKGGAAKARSAGSCTLLRTINEIAASTIAATQAAKNAFTANLHCRVTHESFVLAGCAQGFCPIPQRGGAGTICLALVVGLSDYAAGKGDFAMAAPEDQDEPTEARIGNMIGKIFVVALATFLLWGYWTAIAANLG